MKVFSWGICLYFIHTDLYNIYSYKHGENAYI